MGRRMHQHGGHQTHDHGLTMKTVKITLLTSVASSAYTYAAGQEVDAPEEIAEDLIRGGHAVKSEKLPERVSRSVDKNQEKAEKR